MENMYKIYTKIYLFESKSKIPHIKIYLCPFWFWLNMLYEYFYIYMVH